MMSFWQFMVAHRAEIGEQTVEHIGLTLIALTLAILAGLPVGILLTRHRRLAGGVLGSVGVIQTIPSIALLGFLLPWLGIGVTPAIVALFLYALLPIVRNTYTGIQEVDPAVKEAARGMGMADLQVLTQVELPLAIPVIFAGIRTATIINVGVATLSALIASGGLGEFIFRGIALNNVHMILAGAIPAALLALLLDAILAAIQRHIRRLIKPLLAAVALLLAGALPFLLIPTLFLHSFRAGFTSEFMERADGWPGLRQTYGLNLDTVELDPALMYGALKEKKLDLVSGFATDGRIRAFNLRVLDDDRRYFPPYHAAVLARGETLREHPELRPALAMLAGKISNQTMSELNSQVDQAHEPVARVARRFLESLELNSSIQRDGTPDIVLGSKGFTEQFILAEILSVLIENYTTLDVQLKTGLAGTMICFEALTHGEIDLYPEYSGTGLLVLLNANEQTREKLLQEPESVFEYVREQSHQRWDLEWLEPFGFNNTYALLMRETHAQRLNISSISQLAKYLQQRSSPGLNASP